jgi:Lrp/AsnC family transcriptional regulator for asnA, asnC and gidA
MSAVIGGTEEMKSLLIRAEDNNLDGLDNRIIRLLTENGRMSIGEMVKQLGVTAPTVRKRIKILEKNGIFQVSGLIDPSRHPEMITALVGMSIRSEGKLDQILDKIANLPNVAWAGVATGRYDIIAEVICVEGKEELYRFTTESILKMGNVVSSETFILLKAKNNWLRLPEGVKAI